MVEIGRRRFDNGEKSFEIYNLVNDNGVTVEILSLGGVITKILTPDKEGIFKNIVLELEKPEDYYINDAYRGAIAGRTAGRIGGGKVTIDGKVYEITKNSNGSTLHGGNVGFSKKIWDSQPIKEEDYVGVKLNLKSADGEEGYPGNVEVQVTYILDNEDRLTMEYSGTTDKTTLINLTNHNYYNLSGDGERRIEGHTLRMNSDKICEMGEGSIVTGRLIEVGGTPFDFRLEKALGKDIDDRTNEQIAKGCGYDHMWVLNKDNDTAITFKDPESGRAMDIETNAECVVCYTMNFAEGEMLSCGKKASPRMACCFETQAPPIGFNNEFAELSILRPGEKYEAKTIFKFYVTQ